MPPADEWFRKTHSTGVALLLGDLPPQMLHGVSGAEFGDFIWQHGRPSSFLILMVTFVITLGFMYAYGFRKMGKRAAGLSLVSPCASLMY